MYSIIFTHYGISNYLFYTLSLARYTNPDARIVLLGDEQNREIALKAGCEHQQLDDFTSEMRNEFDSVFRWVQGPKHNPVKNGKDWLKYVFERWFIIEAFCREQGIKEFWHFDSDVMIAKPLFEYGQILKKDGIDYSKQCNGTCLNGYINYDILPAFLQFMIGLFKDESFLAEQQREFDEMNPNFAFTEMRAFDLFSKQSHFNGVILESYFDGVWFDDALAQGDGFETMRVPVCNQSVKKIECGNGEFYAYKNGKKYVFGVLNCSWLPEAVYAWIVESFQKKSKSSIKTILYKMSSMCLREKVRNILKKIGLN